VAARKSAGRQRLRGGYLEAASALVTSFASLIFWSVAFGVCGRRTVFAQAHRAAWWSGWSMDGLRVGRESTRMSHAIGRAAFFVLGVVTKFLQVGWGSRVDSPSEESTLK